MILEQLKQSLLIDRNDLDTALIQQPDLYHQVSEQYAKSISLRDRAKAELEEEAALIDFATRQHAAENDLRITETVVANSIKVDASYRKAQQKYLDLREQTDQWEGLLKSYEQRSYALKELVNLFTAGYWTPEFPKANSQRGAMEDIKNILAEERRSRRKD
jgi:hypothetical protein